MVPQDFCSSKPCGCVLLHASSVGEIKKEGSKSLSFFFFNVKAGVRIQNLLKADKSGVTPIRKVGCLSSSLQFSVSTGEMHQECQHLSFGLVKLTTSVCLKKRKEAART
jgi:hypothetical protein